MNERMDRFTIVTGGLGFLGGHVVEELLMRNQNVMILDNASSVNGLHGSHRAPLGSVSPGKVFTSRAHPESKVLWHNINLATSFGNVDGLILEHGILDAIWHMASLASPFEYKRSPMHTLALGSATLTHLCGIAGTCGAPLLFASSSEVYGNPPLSETPQREEYFGNVSTTGPRSMYDEAKRFGEAVCATMSHHATTVKIARIFNTYGPGMCPSDGRLVSSLIHSAKTGDVFYKHGSGEQNRTFSYVSDTVSGLFYIMEKGPSGKPINVGGIDTRTVNEMIDEVSRLEGVQAFPLVETRPQDEHDPTHRCPDLTKLRGLGWPGPMMPLASGLAHTLRWQKQIA